MAALPPQGGGGPGCAGTGRGSEQGGPPPSSAPSMIPASGTRTYMIPPWPTLSVTESSTTPIPSRSRASPCASARAFRNNFTHGGPLHHARGRHAPFPRNGCTIPAVAMHHHLRSSCTFGAAYAAAMHHFRSTGVGPAVRVSVLRGHGVGLPTVMV